MNRKKHIPLKTCSECIHINACSAWNCGNLESTDASSCANYETVKDSTAYFLGFREAKKEPTP